MNIVALIDYKEYYGEDKELTDAVELIREIPSITLFNFVSGISIKLYLRENEEGSEELQIALVNQIIVRAGTATVEKFRTEYQKQITKGNVPMYFWHYGCLAFYDLVFSNYNDLPSRDLTASEAQRFFDAWLIINSHCNRKVNFTEEQIMEADENDSLEELTIPAFIYQKDFSSTTDFSNQITRGAMLFEYLSTHEKFSEPIAKYYQSVHVSGWLRMFRNIMTVFIEARPDILHQAKQLVDLNVHGENVDLLYLDTLCINADLSAYAPDAKFLLLRKRMLFRTNRAQYFLLSVNFLIDQFYKAQVFAINQYFKENSITNDFLSIKAKEFMEDIYLRRVIHDTVPHLVKHFGDTAIDSKGEELCDVYLRDGNKIIVIEFKDVLLNDGIKQSGKKSDLFKEFDIKFVKNQKNKQKGITQLTNALQDIESHSVSFDETLPNGVFEVFPIILYTDNSFGVEGLNKKYRKKFVEDNKLFEFKKLDIHDLTFVNLSFFEVHENYLKDKLIDIFIMLETYHEHIKAPAYHMTTFEVFSKFYMKENVPQELGLSANYKELTSRLIHA